LAPLCYGYFSKNHHEEWTSKDSGISAKTKEILKSIGGNVE
jgi:hypothetical protein